MEKTYTIHSLGGEWSRFLARINTSGRQAAGENTVTTHAVANHSLGGEFSQLIRLRLKEGRSRSKSDLSSATDIRSRSRKRSGRAIVCQSCKQVITHVENRTAVSGKHEHTCVNPHGVVFHIGCFNSASGCVPYGGRFSHWSWFPGYEWQVILCSNCGIHIGWLFHGSGSEFFGLILARVREQQE